jgi:ribosomal-protein-alanine N-acetyltransferase
MRAYFLTSTRLGFSAWTLDDLPLAAGLWGDPDATKLTGGPFTPAQVSERLEREISNLKRHGIQYWPIFLRETGEHVGCCGLQPRDAETGVYELGFQLCRAFWRRGLAREAAEVVIAHAFTALSARALYAGHHPSNFASRRLLESLGFRYTHNEFYRPTGQMEPCYLLDREERGLTKRNSPSTGV